MNLKLLERAEISTHKSISNDETEKRLIAFLDNKLFLKKNIHTEKEEKRFWRMKWFYKTCLPHVSIRVIHHLFNNLIFK